MFIKYVLADGINPKKKYGSKAIKEGVQAFRSILLQTTWEVSEWNLFAYAAMWFLTLHVEWSNSKEGEKHAVEAGFPMLSWAINKWPRMTKYPDTVIELMNLKIHLKNAPYKVEHLDGTVEEYDENHKLLSTPQK